MLSALSNSGAVCGLLITIVCLSSAGSFSAAGKQANPTAPKTAAAKDITGVPLGGIGAGCIKVMSDGSIGHATINNNWLHPTDIFSGCFGAVSVRSGSQSAARVVSQHNVYCLPAPMGIDYTGAFPQAKLHCAEGSFPDADVTLNAFSPFIPGDLRNSSLPVAAFVFHIVNLSLSPISVAVALSWENTLGVGQTQTGEVSKNHTGDTVASIPDSDGFFGLSFAGPEPLNGQTGAGGVTVASGSSSNMTLMTHPSRNSAVVTTAGWNSRDSKPGWWDTFASEGVVSGSAPRGIQGKVNPAGVVAVQLVLKPHESIDVPMCIAWYSPRMQSPGGDDYGHYYAAEFPNSTYVARAMLDDWQPLLALTEEWQKRITSSAMPAEMDGAIENSVSTLVSNSILARDGRFTLFAGPEAVLRGSSEHSDAYLQQRRYVAGLLLALFPQLYAQEMVNLLAGRMKDGVFSTSAPDWAGRLGPAMSPEDPTESEEGNPIDLPASAPQHPRSNAGPPQTDLAARADTSEYVLQADKLVAASGDLMFLNHAMRNIRSLVQVFLDHDEAFHPISGSSTLHELPDAILAEWQTALRSARRLATIAEDHAFEWAVPAGPLGTSPGGLIEIATEQQFSERCESAITKLEDEIGKRGAVPQAVSPTPGSPASQLLLSTESDGLKQAAGWEILEKLEGYGIDLQSGELNLYTPIPGTWRSLSAPVFSATFVGRVEFKPTAHGGTLTLRIDRTITLSPVRTYRHRAGATGGPELTIRTMRIAGPPPAYFVAPTVPGNPKQGVRLIDVHVSLGLNPIGCTYRLEPSGTLLITFTSPLTLAAGDLLQIEVL